MKSSGLIQIAIIMQYLRIQKIWIMIVYCLCNKIKLASNWELYYCHQDDAGMLMSTSIPQFYDTPPSLLLICKSISIYVIRIYLYIQLSHSQSHHISPCQEPCVHLVWLWCWCWKLFPHWELSGYKGCLLHRVCCPSPRIHHFCSLQQKFGIKIRKSVINTFDFTV